MDYSPWDCRRVGHDLATKPQFPLGIWVHFSSVFDLSGYLCTRCTLFSKFMFIFSLSFLIAQQGMRDLNSLTRDRTYAPCNGNAET